MTSPQNIDFKLFIALWNRLQGQTTPAIHFRMAHWLESSWTQRETKLLLQAFRSSGKSTIVGLFAAWLLLRNPDLRILVLAADSILARKMVRNVKRIIERHPLTAHLKPAKLDQWGSDRFTINRKKELRDPSMLARGISSNMTGSRADVILCDDVEVPNTCDTPDKRADLRERLAEIDFVLVPGGMQLYIGTPHSWYTIYAGEPRKETGEDEAFLDAFKRLKIPVLNNKGESTWPERFTAQDIAHMKRATGPNKFASQMMLEPVNIAEGRLDPARLQFYNAPLQMSDELKGLYIQGKRLISASAWWDPAFGHAGGDRSVLAIVYTDEDGQYWLQKLAYISRTPGTTLDEATDQCQQIVALAKDHFLPSIRIEINGIGKFLPNILRRELAQKNVPCSVLEIANTRPKDLRILESFDAVLAAQALNVHEDIRKTPFINEMMEWQPGRSKGHDDGLDAVAGALSCEPVRLKRLYPVDGSPSWTGRNQSHKAKTDFDV